MSRHLVQYTPIIGQSTRVEARLYLNGVAKGPSAAAHAGPLTPASLLTAVAPRAGPVRALEAGWVAGPPSQAGWVV